MQTFLNFVQFSTEISSGMKRWCNACHVHVGLIIPLQGTHDQNGKSSTDEQEEDVAIVLELLH